MSQNEAEFAAEVLVSGVPKPLTYGVLQSELQVGIGSAVTVDVGRRQTTGWVVKTFPLEKGLERLAEYASAKAATADKKQLGLFAETETKAKLKLIHSSVPGFLPEQLPLFEWMAEYYGVPLVEIIENAVPRRHQGRIPLMVEICEEARQQFEDSEEWRAQLRKRSKVQFAILEALTKTTTPRSLADLSAIAKTARTAITALQKKGIVEIFDENSLSHLFPLPAEEKSLGREAMPELTPQQSVAVQKINEMLDRKAFAAALLYGVTGSGKTEVYLRAIDKVLAEGGSALVIVPEIALTPQLFDRFESRLAEPPALLHSQVGAGARWKAWENILLGKSRVAIGARSAIFAPLPNLRLVIVDEEHESSYKQSEGLRYHARDVAVMRGKFAGAAVVLGSATPSFESLVNTKRGRYELIQLPDRVSSRPMPVIELADLNKIKRREMASESISPQLAKAMEETLEKSGQIIILYNRRGFSSFLQCETCGEVVTCLSCSVTMTYHRGKNRLLCHYCNERMSPPKYCVHCRDPKTSRIELPEDASAKEIEQAEEKGLLVPRGSGTEKVVDEIALLFPQARIVRLDRDTTGRKDSYRNILGSMRTGDADILVGTQMIAKGHDLPGVTLVGIIDADVGLHTPDFRSSERIYQLITQASGRAGRGTEPGRVVVQTREPNHPTIVATMTGRFLAFAKYELDHRMSLGYPPWGRLLRVIVSCPNPTDAHGAAIAVREFLNSVKQQLNASEAATQAEGAQPGEPVKTAAISILGPAPAPLEKLRGRYRWHLIVKSVSSRLISEIAGQLCQWRMGRGEFPELRVNVDVDPQDML